MPSSQKADWTVSFPGYLRFWYRRRGGCAKHRNANTGYLLLSLEGNQHLIQLSPPEAAQFDPAAPVVELRGANGAFRWTVHADGQQTSGPKIGLMSTPSPGPPASMRAADGYLEVRGGASGCVSCQAPGRQRAYSPS